MKAVVPTGEASPCRRVRKLQGITAEGLAVKANISSTTVTRLEKYGATSLVTAEKIALALNVSVDVVLGRGRS